jgi:chromosome segregation ATPase
VAKSEQAFKNALLGKKLPILTLDNKWHRLFTQAEQNSEINKLSEKLNELLMRQGKLNTESKELRAIKKKLLDEIVNSQADMNGNPDKKTQKKLDENKRLIDEANDKLEAYTDELKFLPSEIDKVNYDLMLATMDACYDYLTDNAKEVKDIDAWISAMRIELKKNIIKKQAKEAKNKEMYSYMHDIFGASVIELFDMKYDM